MARLVVGAKILESYTVTSPYTLFLYQKLIKETGPAYFICYEVHTDGIHPAALIEIEEEGFQVTKKDIVSNEGENEGDIDDKSEGTGKKLRCQHIFQDGTQCDLEGLRDDWPYCPCHPFPPPGPSMRTDPRMTTATRNAADPTTNITVSLSATSLHI